MEEPSQGSLFQTMGDSLGGDFLGGTGDGSIWTNEIGVFNMVSQIDEILDRGDFSLEDLLDEGELLQEVKGMNTRLLEYLSQKEILEKLIDHFTSSPSAEEGNEKSDDARFVHKFPYVACEVICCDMKDIVERILFDDSLLMRIFQVLDNKSPIEPRLAGYFYKVFCVLTARNPEYMLLKCSTLVRASNKTQNACSDEVEKQRNDEMQKSDEKTTGDNTKTLENANKEADLSIAKARNAGGTGMKNSELEDREDEKTPIVYISDWLLDKLLLHLDNYSVMSVFRTLFQIASGAPIDGLPADTIRLEAGFIKGEWGDSQSETEKAFEHIRQTWSGGKGTALKLLNVLETSQNSDVHSNASDLLADMLQQVAYGPSDAEVASPTEGDSDLSRLGESFAQGLNLNQDASTGAVHNGVPAAPKWCVLLADELMKVVLRSDPPSSAEGESSPSIHGRYNDASEAVAGLSVLIQLVDAFSRPTWRTPGETNTPKPILQILQHLPKMCEALRNGSAGQLRTEDALIKTQWGGTIVRLGMKRFKMVQLLFMLVHSKFPLVINEISNLDQCPLEICLDLFFDFEWNNVLHAVVETLVRFVLTGGVSDEEIRQEAEIQRQIAQHQFQQQQQMSGPDDMYPRFGGQSPDVDAAFNSPEAKEDRLLEQNAAHRILAPLQECLFNRVGLVGRLLDAYERNGESIDVAKQHNDATVCKDGEDPKSSVASTARHGQIGYMGFCHLMSNAIVDLAKEEATCKEQTEVHTTNVVRNTYALDATSGERWQHFLSNELAGISMVENCLLGGAAKPSRSAMDELGEEGEMEGLDAFQEQGEGGKHSSDLFQFAFTGGSYDDESDEEDEDEEEEGSGFQEGDLQHWNPFQNDQDSPYFEVEEGVEVNTPAFDAGFDAFGISSANETAGEPLQNSTTPPSDATEQKGWATDKLEGSSTFDPFADA